MLKKTVLLTGLYLSLLPTWSQQPEKPFAFEISYTGDHVQNVKGGIKTGYAYLGMINLQATVNTQNAGWWKGGQFSILAVNTHGATPSTDLIGDTQVTSNIEAGNHTYLQELWYKQSIGKVDFTIGLQDLNATFANSEYKGLFLNSSFGITPVISGNITAPLFPLTTLGLTANWQLSEKANWLNALHDGSPTDFDYNPYNLKWSFATGDGTLFISEWQQKTEINKLPGTYKIGFYTHNHLIESKFRKHFPDSLNHSITGFYTSFDQKIWEKDSKNIGIFAQGSYSPSPTSTHPIHWGMGLQTTGLFTRSQDDVLGIAVAYEKFSANAGSETAIELTWQKEFFGHLSLKPDLQYIINPSGNQRNLSNCLMGILRVEVSY